LITYLSIFIYLTTISLCEIKLSDRTKKIYFILLFIFMLLFISARHYVGGDYISYLNLFDYFDYQELNSPNQVNPFLTADGYTSSGFFYIMAIIHKLNLNYFSLNLICALIYLTGIFKFLKISNERLFVFILLIPTMIYVVGMGYTRQSVSIGFLCFAIYYWTKNSNIKKFIFFILSIYMHIASIIFIFLFFFKSYEKIKFTKNLIIGILFISLLLLFYTQTFDSLDDFSSALQLDDKIVENSRFKYLKFLAHLVPCIIFIVFLKEFKKDKRLYPLYFCFFVSTITVIIGMNIFKQILAESSYIEVIADRILLPFLLIESLIFVRLCSVINFEFKFLFKFLILFYFGLMLFIWLEFAANSHAWKPYRSILLEW
jgi:hypothetical protein